MKNQAEPYHAKDEHFFIIMSYLINVGLKSHHSLLGA